MKKLEWFERKFAFGLPAEMLPFYLERLEGTIARLNDKVKNHSDDILSEKCSGKWSIKQNIGHLAEVDEISNKRIDEILNGTPTLSPAVFEPKQDYNAQPILDVLTFFREKRISNLARYNKISPSDTQKTSLHPRLKVQLSVVDLAWFDAEHDDHHLVRISEILNSLSSKNH
jgi:hypothetical protein